MRGNVIAIIDGKICPETKQVPASCHKNRELGDYLDYGVNCSVRSPLTLAGSLNRDSSTYRTAAPARVSPLND